LPTFIFNTFRKTDALEYRPDLLGKKNDKETN